VSKESKANVIIPQNLDNPPEKHEISAAWILARYFNCEVKFMKPVDGYHVKTADFLINGLAWEIKSPEGKSRKNTIKNQFENAKGKSKHLIIDARRCKELDDDFIINKARYELKNHRSVHRLLFISKNEKVLEIK